MARILLVDDNQAVTEIMRALLLRNGFEVHVANSTQGALALLARVKVDVVISDVVMPGQDGYALGREVRSNPATASLPIIYLTALDSVEDEFEAWLSGADAYMVKPFKARDLLANIERVLMGRTRMASSGRLGALAGPLRALAAVADSASRARIEAAAKSAGLQITFLDNVDDALKRLDRERFDLLVCDADLPKFSARAISDYLRYFALNIPVVALSDSECEGLQRVSKSASAHELAEALRAIVHDRA